MVQTSQDRPAASWAAGRGSLPAQVGRGVPTRRFEGGQWFTGFNVRVGVLISVCCLLTPQGALGTEKTFDGPFGLAWQAYLAAVSSLHSGAGTGSFEWYEQEKGEKALRLIAKAKTTIRFDGPKYYVRLDYEKQRASDSGLRIIIDDGSGLFVSTFDENIHPMGAMGEVWHRKPSVFINPPAEAQFFFNPNRLPESVISLDAVVEHHAPDGIKLVKQADGSYTGEYNLEGDTHVEFDVSPDAGYNVVALRAYVTKDRFLHQDWKVTWKQASGVWFISSIDNRTRFISGMSSRKVLRYDTFEPNAKVPPETFQFDALELPPGARILDRRPNVPAEVYQNLPKGETDTAKMDGLIDSLHALPMESPSPPSLRSRLRIPFLVASGVLALLGLVLLWRRVLRRRGSRRPAQGTPPRALP